jgi:hypothetical protein
MSAETYEFDYRKVELADGPSSDVLLPPGVGELGGEEAIVPGSGNLRLEDVLEVQVARSPFVARLSDFYSLGHGDPLTPKDVTSLGDYEYWLVVHALNVVRRGDSVALAALGYHAELGEEPKKAGIVTVDMAPQTQMVARNGAKVSVDAEGVFGPPPKPEGLVAMVWNLAKILTFKLSAKVRLVGSLDFSSKSAVVAAVGTGQPWCEWRFVERGSPLVGDLIMVQTLRVPCGVPAVACWVRGYLQIAKWFEWTRVPRLKWTDRVDIELRPAAAVPASTAAKVSVGRLEEARPGGQSQEQVAPAKAADPPKRNGRRAPGKSPKRAKS